MLHIKDITVDPEVIYNIHEQKEIIYPASNDVAINSYALFRNSYDPKNTALVRYHGNNLWKKLAPNKQLSLQSIAPKDAYQTAYVDCLISPSILLNIAVGSAGTGKTTLALAYATEQLISEGKPIILSKPTSMVGEGRAFGPVPGDIGEKYAPYLASYDIVFKKLLGDQRKDFVEQSKNKGNIQFMPIELARGCTFENCTFILDEAQNMTWHEMNTIVSRIGENSKMLILGDLNQIDTDLHKTETGLWKLIHNRPFQDSKLTSVIELQTQYRSPIVKLVTEINTWISENARKQRISDDYLEITEG